MHCQYSPTGYISMAFGMCIDWDPTGSLLLPMQLTWKFVKS